MTDKETAARRIVQIRQEIEWAEKLAIKASEEGDTFTSTLAQYKLKMLNSLLDAEPDRVA